MESNKYRNILIILTLLSICSYYFWVHRSQPPIDIQKTEYKSKTDSLKTVIDSLENKVSDLNYKAKNVQFKIKEVIKPVPVPYERIIYINTAASDLELIRTIDQAVERNSIPINGDDTKIKTTKMGDFFDIRRSAITEDEREG